MAGPGLYISSIDGLPQIEGFIAGLPESLKAQAERALDEAAAAIYNRLRTGFLAEQDPWGKPWIPSKAGAERKALKLGQTLFATGRLFRSIQVYKSEGERQIGTDVSYAPKHNFGQEGNLQRVFLALTDEHIELAQAIFNLRLAEALK